MRKLFGLVALLLVLALGVAIGAGPLGDRLNDETGQSAETDAGKSTGETGDLGGSDPLDSAFIAQVAPAQLAGALTNQAVSVISLPGASASIRTAVNTNIVAAGGAVASTVEVTEELTDPASKQLVEALGSQLIAQVPGVVDQSLTTYPRMGALLGAAVGTNGTTATQDPIAVDTIRDALATGGFVTAPITGGPASMILVLAGDGLDDAILTGLLTGMQSQTKGLVLAGVTNDGDVASVRDAALVIGTYDGTETAAGQVSSITLLARQITQAGGSYGASGSDGSVLLK